MTSKLMDYFNKQLRIGVLSTASKDGKVDSAIFGSPNMIDEKTVVVATGKNRTFSNLQEKPLRDIHDNGTRYGMERDQGLYEDEGLCNVGGNA